MEARALNGYGVDDSSGDQVQDLADKVSRWINNDAVTKECVCAACDAGIPEIDQPLRQGAVKFDFCGNSCFGNLVFAHARPVRGKGIKLNHTVYTEIGVVVGHFRFLDWFGSGLGEHCLPLSAVFIMLIPLSTCLM